MLVALYQATNGDSWLRSDNWLTDSPIGRWYGVVTDSGDRVVKLNLSENGLIGSIPPELGNLTELKSLGLADNRLSGEIPPELGNLIYLETLYLNNNELSGEIPPELGELFYLEWLYLYLNQLSGEIPAELGQLTNLRHLDLADNRLSGSIRYQERNLVERFINKLKWCRRISTRYEKLARRFIAFLHFASTLIWLRRNVNGT